MQAQALERLRQLGVPTRKTEDWHFFPVTKIPAELSEAIASLKPEDSDEDSSSKADRFRIAEETDFSALLPIAFGAKIFEKRIPDNAAENGILKPHDEFSHTAFRIGKGAKASLEILGNKISRDLSAERLDFFVEEGAELELFSTEEGHARSESGKQELRFRSIRIHQAANSKVNVLDLNRTGSLSRMNLECHLEGENAEFGFRAIAIVSGDANVHGFLRIHHDAPHCTSRQFVRNLISGNAFVSYDGEVFAGKNNPGTDSSELVNTMLLSEGAKVSVKPVLKIYNDDVECTHGNTCGSLEEDNLFYLESRGLDRSSAEKLLIRAFAMNVVAEHPGTPGKDRISKILAEIL